MPFRPEFLWNNIGARRNKKRVGRGPGSGLGKTSGAGHKGQHARANTDIPLAFEGGQSDLKKRTPKQGFRMMRFNAKKPLVSVNMSALIYQIQKGNVDLDQPIT
mmetsp:Transcript_7710/g.10068  ORF Transcript_7710/g.10068 Transcript_7710/m.10068 type:complete len:104 (-) Transcript_7710:588-899(-)